MDSNCLVLLAALLCVIGELASIASAFRMYRARQEILNMLVYGGQANEERLFLEDATTSENSVRNGHLATDGAVISEWTQCCTVTGPVPWFKAQLETPSYVTRVVIHTMEPPSSKIQNGLYDFAIIISGTTCHRQTSSRMFHTKSFPCDTFGEEIQIQSYMRDGSNGDGATLALCEVEAFGLQVKFEGMDSGIMEIQGISTCDMSDHQPGKECNNAIDRNFIEREVKDVKVCAQTEVVEHPWFAVYFSIPALISHVKLYGNQDACCKDDLKAFSIRVNEGICKSRVPGPVRPGGEVFECEKFGSYVQVVSDLKHGRLSICQIQIFGHKMMLIPDNTFGFLGCYQHNETDFDTLVSPTFMSPNKCNRMCKRAGKSNFALQNGVACLCGKKTNSVRSADPNTDCSIECLGNPKIICGGVGYNSVYEIYS